MGPRPNLSYEYRGYTPKWGWRVVREKLEAVDREGRLAWSKTGRPYLKRYLHEQRGTPVSSLWIDIPPISGRAAERQGYPTQKPEALLERIVMASSNRGDVVLDPFCGCGTTIAVAHRLGRRWIGIDISLTAAEVIKRRMEVREGVYGINIVGVPETEDDLRALEPLEFQNWVIRRIHGSHSGRMTGDLGIDGYSFFERLPVQVKQSDRVGRNVVDNFETAIQRDGPHKGYIIAFSFTKGAYEEAARVKQMPERLEVELVEVSTLLGDPGTRRDGSDMLQDLLRGIQVALRSPTVPEPPHRTAKELAGVDSDD